MRPLRAGFTLVEILITLGIISLLLTLTLPMMAGALSSARAFQCQMGLRSIAFDFSIFADDELHGDRGDDDREPVGRFRLMTFVESQYGIDEFWRFGAEQTEGKAPDEAGNDPMRCSEVSGDLFFTRGNCETMRTIDPPEHVSYGFNIRLHRVERIVGGFHRLDWIWLKSAVLETSNVPLVWDVDGAAARAKNRPPTFTGPSLGSTGPLGGDRYWFPAYRHLGECNIAFMDGHVDASADLLANHDWDWAYQGAR
ncbi:MAG: prepilin-type N-terminal cleavage/methylation domain-containing protein [Phycisphaerales bacterium]|nr:prepilin-type N-terminal cleavage/methylation domain-containing protein [Phycisphaerales bacterium]